MSFISSIRNRIAETVEDADKAAANAAGKAREAVTSVVAAAGEQARSALAAPPPASPSCVAHAQQAVADAVRNASPPPPKKRAGTEAGIFVGAGGSAAAGVDTGVGGQASAGYVIGAAGTTKTYGSTGTVNGSMGAAAGAGFEAGVAFDVRDFYGDGYQLTLAVPGTPVSVSASFTRDEKKLSAVSVGVGKSIGGGLFEFDTRTQDTTGR